MADLIDKAILIGIGLEKKAKEVLEELQQAGKAAKGAEGAEKPAEELTPKQLIENKVVEDGVKALKEFLGVVRSARERLEKDLTSSSGKVLEKLNVPTSDDLDIVKEMARIAREKVDRLEKKVEELEARLGKAQ
ncbi:MAG: accessory factor UbiK family protein [Deltaproteobacteria bacterium]|nr:accessory factor UbiK family protein [Deltaproteobacteria bacterium]